MGVRVMLTEMLLGRDEGTSLALSSPRHREYRNFPASFPMHFCKSARPNALQRSTFLIFLLFNNSTSSFFTFLLNLCSCSNEYSLRNSKIGKNLENKLQEIYKIIFN